MTTASTTPSVPAKAAHTAPLVFAVDVYESATEVRLIGDLPAVPTDGLAIHLENQELRVEGQRRDGRVYRRRFTVPLGIDADHIAAELTNGVLTVHLPKKPEAGPRRIEVTAA